MKRLLPNQPVTAEGHKPSRELVEIIQRLTVGGSSGAAWGGITGTLADQNDLQTALDGKADDPHTHVAADVSDLATTVQAYTLDSFADPVASVDFSQEQALQFVIENRTSDPVSPVTGQLWLRTDL